MLEGQKNPVILNAVAGLLVLVSPFLGWVGAGGISATAFMFFKNNSAWTFVACGAIFILDAALTATGKRFPGLAVLRGLGIAAVMLLTAVFYADAMDKGGFGLVSIGAYLPVIGVIMLIVASVMNRKVKKANAA